MTETAMEEETLKMEETKLVADEDDELDSKEIVTQKYFLIEWKLLKSLIDDIVSNGRVSDNASVKKIRSIIDKYQEQGQLLEPYLESMVSPLMSIIRFKTIEQGVASDDVLKVIKPLCIIIYTLVTVCGYKAVIKFFPHQVPDLEVAVSLLDKCHDTNSATSLRQESTGEMEAKCVILLWLCILVLVPFDISSVDTSTANSQSLGQNEPPPLVLRIVGFCKDYLSNAGPMRIIAGLLLSRLLTRPDMPKAFISFLGWTHEILSSDSDDIMGCFRIVGAVEALASIFKAGSRNVLLDVAFSVWSDTSILSKTSRAARSPLLRKSIMKLSQRIGLTCLPHRSLQWRYVGRNSSLGENMSLSGSNRNNQHSHDADQDFLYLKQNESFFQGEEEMDVPEVVEEIIELLLTGLRDTDTVVRWSAAKGIGRITSRLTPALSEEVLSSVLELFSPGEGDGSWHGGCLAVAELARRGLLLPITLQKVVPFVVKALHYDIRRGHHSVGSHVRDAAAYVCWAFGRAYYHTDMRSILEQLAPHLLTVACYDREVNCRRAAAAAFQENVGRQGNYPHGIDIVNTADYFSLSSRLNSYLHVAACIAQYEGYLYPFADELLYKICHWDKSLRELAAQSVSTLVKYDLEYFANFLMEKLSPCTLSSDLCMRHGATLAAAEIVLALHKCNYHLPPEKQKHVADIIPAIEKAQLYRRKGGEIMRAAVSRFIECISLVRVILPEKIKQSLLSTLYENLRHPNSQIQNAAVNAIKQYVPAYLVAEDITSKYLEQLTDHNVATRRGSALALGVLPFEILSKDWRIVILKLCSSCAIEDKPRDRDAEARVNAIRGLVSVCETLTEAREDSNFQTSEDGAALFLLIKNEVMQSLLKALEDYSVDNGGDVGSWVREASMDGLERCTYILCKRDSTGISESSPLFDADLAATLVSGILKQAVEKLDKIREVASKVLQRILYNETIFVPYIPYREKLEVALKWGVATYSYPSFVKLLQFKCYRRSLLSGLVISIGGLQESLSKASTTALWDYLQASKTVDRNKKITREVILSTDILWVLQQYKKCDRVIIPTLKTIEILFSKRVFLTMEDRTPSFCAGVLDSLAVELKASKDFSKLYAGIAILGYIASVSDPVNARAFAHLLTFLAHRFPKIRQTCAEQVYLVLLENGNLMADDEIEKALEVISETCWESDMEDAKKKRLQLYDMAGVETVQLLKPKNGVVPNKGGEKTSTSTDENASYSSLVDSSGF